MKQRSKVKGEECFGNVLGVLSGLGDKQEGVVLLLKKELWECATECKEVSLRMMWV